MIPRNEVEGSSTSDSKYLVGSIIERIDKPKYVYLRISNGDDSKDFIIRVKRARDKQRYQTGNSVRILRDRTRKCSINEKSWKNLRKPSKAVYFKNIINIFNKQ